MEIQVKNTLLKLPDKIYLDQLMALDINQIQKISKMLNSQTEEVDTKTLMPVLQWFFKLFKVLGVSHRFDLPEFTEFINHDQFIPWFKGLFGNF